MNLLSSQLATSFLGRQFKGPAIILTSYDPKIFSTSCSDTRSFCDIRSNLYLQIDAHDVWLSQETVL